jgi:hypothetical protein
VGGLCFFIFCKLFFIVLDLKNNPISDRRLLKLIDQCRTKQIIDYVKAHCPKTKVKTPDQKSKNKTDNESDSDEGDFKHVIRVHYAKDNTRVVINESVKSVREFLVACLVSNVTFTEETFKKFIQIQNKLHETVCSKRNLATIATHDFNKLVIERCLSRKSHRRCCGSQSRSFAVCDPQTRPSAIL